MPGLAKGLTIHVSVGGGSDDDEYNPTEAEMPKEQEMNQEHKKQMNRLLIRLSNRDALDDSSLIKLTEDVLMFCRKMLACDDVIVLREFLKEAKHMLTPDMRDMLSDDLKLNKMLNEKLQDKE